MISLPLVLRSIQKQNMTNKHQNKATKQQLYICVTFHSRQYINMNVLFVSIKGSLTEKVPNPHEPTGRCLQYYKILLDI